MNKHYNIAMTLCSVGASLSVMNTEGNPPLHYAPRTMHSQLQGNFLSTTFLKQNIEVASGAAFRGM